MKRMMSVALFLLTVCVGVLPAYAQSEEPTVYVIQKGDTLWGLSDRFFRDPGFWPNLWSRNQKVTNPHFIFPGQRLKFYPDRVEIETDIKKEDVNKSASEAPKASAPIVSEAKEESIPEKIFLVSGSEGFLQSNGSLPAGFIISTYQNRQMVGEDDIVYTDIGQASRAKVGDRFSIYKKLNAVSHPISNLILGYLVIPLGTLQLTELEERVSKAIVTKSYMEIGAGSFLMPYREKKRNIPLKAAENDLTGYIVETQTGNKAIASGDVVFLDLGKSNGLVVGNLLYVVRDITPDQKFMDVPVKRLPSEVIGAMVIVDSGETTSTALVVKSIDTIYRGDRVEMRKSIK
ncbi:MAG: LysM peptidoglycan-binding domain-containing protein [Geobacteraceae bacterium]